MKIIDQIHRVLNFKETPKRIISLVPSQTELLCDLGLEFLLIGVTKFCVHPHQIKANTTVVGGTKKINLDRIKKLRPDIILCNKEENTKEIVEACASICTVHVSDIYTINDSLKLISQYGSIFNVTTKASILISEIKKEIECFNDFIKDAQVVNVAYFIWKNPWMVAANNTFINYLLKLNKFNNVYATKTRYPEVELSKTNPENGVDLVLLSSEPFPFKKSHIAEAQVYYPNARIITVDGEMFSWYGSRLIKAFLYFKNLHLSLQNSQPY